MGKLIMGYWDCPFCGSKGVRGDIVNCPSCGRARGDVQFYMKEHAETQSREENERGDLEYLTEEQSAKVSKNPDWYCSFCNSLNSDNAAFCGNCGATREDSESNYFDQLKKRQEKEAAEAAAQLRPSERAAKPNRKPLFILLAVVLAIIGIIVFLNGSKTSGGLQVTGLSWAREIQIEEYRNITEENWSVPQDGTVTGQVQKIHHYDSVLDHYRTVQRSRQVVDHYETYYTYSDRGNGTFEEIPHERPVYKTEYYDVEEPVYVQVPRYQTWYTYTVWRWVPSRVAKSSGEDHHPEWPDPELTENEREAENARSDVYRFTVVNEKGETKTYRIDESNWNELEQGGTVYITATRTGARPFLSDQKGNKIADLQADP